MTEKGPRHPSVLWTPKQPQSDFGILKCVIEILHLMRTEALCMQINDFSSATISPNPITIKIKSNLKNESQVMKRDRFVDTGSVQLAHLIGEEATRNRAEPDLGCPILLPLISRLTLLVSLPLSHSDLLQVSPTFHAPCSLRAFARAVPASTCVFSSVLSLDSPLRIVGLQKVTVEYMIG